MSFLRRKSKEEGATAPATQPGPGGRLGPAVHAEAELPGQVERWTAHAARSHGAGDAAGSSSRWRTRRSRRSSRCPWRQRCGADDGALHRDAAVVLARREIGPIGRHALYVLESTDALDMTVDTFFSALLHGETDTSGYPDYAAIVGGLASHWDEPSGELIVRAVVGWGGKGQRGDTDRIGQRLLSSLYQQVIASGWPAERPTPPVCPDRRPFGAWSARTAASRRGSAGAFHCPKCGMRMSRSSAPTARGPCGRIGQYLRRRTIGPGPIVVRVGAPNSGAVRNCSNRTEGSDGASILSSWPWPTAARPSPPTSARAGFDALIDSETALASLSDGGRIDLAVIDCDLPAETRRCSTRRSTATSRSRRCSSSATRFPSSRPRTYPRPATSTR